MDAVEFSEFKCVWRWCNLY